MDRASASEAGNVGSTPAGRIFLTKTRCFVVAYLLEYLRATARVSTVFLPLSRLEEMLFILKKHSSCTVKPGPEENLVRNFTVGDSRRAPSLPKKYFFVVAHSAAFLLEYKP